MRTVTFKSQLEGVAALMGIPPANLAAADAARIAAFLTTEVGRGWDWDFFPEWTTIERRAYRPTWVTGGTYAAGTEVFFETDELYYTANSAPNNPAAGESPATHAAKWTELTTFARYVALDQTGLTPIGEVRRVCKNDPRIYPTRPGELPFDVTELGIVPDPSAGARVYLQFRLRPPAFTSTEWSGATAYLAGDLVYRGTVTGECYKALAATTNEEPEDTPAKWVKQDLPYVLSRFARHAAFASALLADGQEEKAAREEKRAELFLLEAADTAGASQGQFDSATVQTY